MFKSSQSVRGVLGVHTIILMALFSLFFANSTHAQTSTHQNSAAVISNDALVRGAFANEQLYNEFVTHRLLAFYERMLGLSLQIDSIINLDSIKTNYPESALTLASKFALFETKLEQSKVALDALGTYTKKESVTSNTAKPMNEFGEIITFEEQRKITRGLLDDSYALLSILLIDIKDILSSTR